MDLIYEGQLSEKLFHISSLTSHVYFVFLGDFFALLVDLEVGFALEAAFFAAVVPGLEVALTAVLDLAGSFFVVIAIAFTGAVFVAVFFAVAVVLDSVAAALPFPPLGARGLDIGFLTIAFLACTAVFNLTSPDFGFEGVTADCTKVPQELLC